MTLQTNRARVAALPLALSLSLALLSPALEAAPAAAEAGALMTLSAEASRIVPNDRATVTFTAESQKPSAAEASAEAAKAGNAALAALKALGPGVEAQTVDLSTWPVYREVKAGEVKAPGAWRVRQSIRVTVRDLALLPQALAAGGASMDYDGIQFGISREAREAAEDALLAEAIEKAGRRAAVAAEALGLDEKHVRIETLSTNASGPSVRYLALPAAANSLSRAAADAAPTVSAGSGEVTVRVQMTARIRP